MYFYWLLAWLAGLAGVVQSGLTKRLSEKAGLAGALHVSNIVVLVGGVLILTALSKTGEGEFTSLLKVKLNNRTWTWWFLIPGIMGLFFITVMPYAILKLDALKVFVAVVFGQVIGSALWDRFMEGIPLDRWRVVGSAMTLMGALAVSQSKGGG